MELFEIVVLLAGILTFYPGFINAYPRYALLLIIVVLFETIITHYSSIVFGSNILVYNVYAQILIGLYAAIVVREMNVMALNIWYFEMFIAIWIGVVLLRWIYFSSYLKVDVYSYVFGMTIVVVAMLFLLYKKVVNADFDCFKEPFFYLGIGVSLFFCSSFVLLLLVNSIIANGDNAVFYQEILEHANLILSIGYLSSVICIIYRLRLTK